MKTNHLFPLLPTLAAMPLSAQEQAKPKTLPVVALKKRTTFSDFAEFLREETGRNVVLASDVAGFLAPELLLQNVSLQGLLNIVDEMSADVEIGTGMNGPYNGQLRHVQIHTLALSASSAESVLAPTPTWQTPLRGL